MRTEKAELIGIAALTFIAGRERLLTALLKTSGLRADDIRHAAADTDFLAGVLAFLLEDDQRLVDFCDQEKIQPDTVHRAQHTLSNRSNDA